MVQGDYYTCAVLLSTWCTLVLCSTWRLNRIGSYRVPSFTSIFFWNGVMSSKWMQFTFGNQKMFAGPWRSSPLRTSSSVIRPWRLRNYFHGHFAECMWGTCVFWDFPCFWPIRKRTESWFKTQLLSSLSTNGRLLLHIHSRAHRFVSELKSQYNISQLNHRHRQLRGVTVSGTDCRCSGNRFSRNVRSPGYRPKLNRCRWEVIRPASSHGSFQGCLKRWTDLLRHQQHGRFHDI